MAATAAPSGSLAAAARPLPPPPPPPPPPVLLLLLLLLLVALLPRRADAQAYALTSACPAGLSAFYTLAGGALSACCPAPGTTIVSPSLGCQPDASMGGPLDTAFALSGYAAEGAAGLALTGAAPTFVADRFNTPARALALSVGSNLDTTGAAIAANMPSGNGAMSASAWLRCNATAVGNSAAVISFGPSASSTPGSPRFGVLVSSPTLAGPLSNYATSVASLRISAGSPPSDANIPLSGPYGVGADPANQLLYIADTGNNRIRVANLATAQPDRRRPLWRSATRTAQAQTRSLPGRAASFSGRTATCT